MMMVMVVILEQPVSNSSISVTSENSLGARPKMNYSSLETERERERERERAQKGADQLPPHTDKVRDSRSMAMPFLPPPHPLC